MVKSGQFQADSLPNTQVHADEFSLEDVITHILRNADRYCIPGSVIHINLTVSGAKKNNKLLQRASR